MDPAVRDVSESRTSSIAHWARLARIRNDAMTRGGKHRIANVLAKLVHDAVTDWLRSFARPTIIPGY